MKINYPRGSYFAALHQVELDLVPDMAEVEVIFILKHEMLTLQQMLDKMCLLL